MKRIRRYLPTVLCIAIILTASGLFAQVAGDGKAMSFDDYARWRTIGSTVISDNGNWITFSYRTRTMDDTLYVKNPTAGTKYEVPRGSNPKFSDDSKWVAYTISLPFKEAEKLRKDKKTVTQKTQLINLLTGEKTTYENTTSFRFSKGSGYLAVKKAKTDKDAKHNGTDLIMRNLERGYDDLIGNVGSFSFNKPSTMMGYTTDAADKDGNGISVMYLNSGGRRPLSSGKADYAQMTWDDEGSVIAVLKGTKDKKKVHKDNVLLAFTSVQSGEPTIYAFDPSAIEGFPEKIIISEKGTLSWNKELSKVFFGVKFQEDEPEKDEDAEPVSTVDIFHWQDDRIQTVQKVRANRDKNFTYQSVYNLTNKRFIRLADESMRTIALSRDGEWGIGSDQREYLSDWKKTRADYYRVNTSTGERTLILKEQGRTLGISPDSKHFIYWQDKSVWLYNRETNEKTNLTKTSPVPFVNAEEDHPGTKPPYGVSGWTKDGKAVVLNHRYDLWLQPLDGSKATNLTGGLGAKDEIRFRYVRLDPEKRFIDLSKPVLLSAYGQWTKKAGYYELNNGYMDKLIYDDKRFGTVRKAKNADKYLHTIETFADFPDYYVSDSRFSSPERMTEANPQQSEFTWGRRILFDFKNKDGVRLQGTLAVPDDYVEGQRLPMIVNFYEKNSQNLHRYTAPRYASSPQFARFVSNGYLVMQPDIHFRTRTTHSDMLECVEAAVKKVIEMGYADPERVGLHGHSYSGGGSAYIATKSNMFAAIASGAAPINLLGEFNIIFTGSGQNNHRYDIYGQGRYGTNPYDDPDLYRDQSPITWVRTMDTPLLYLHGVDDPTVEYNQGLEFYNALRFNNKPVIFLSYPGELHSLRKIENQKDYTRRVNQFFDHHLKGKKAPDWMVKGVPFLKKKK